MEKYLTEGAPTPEDKQSVLDAINWAIDRQKSVDHAIRNGRRAGKAFFGREMKDLEKKAKTFNAELEAVRDRVVRAMEK
jgi:hypothetical protein